MLARPDRFERPTPWFEAKCSIQMSYGRLVQERWSHRSGVLWVRIRKARCSSLVAMSVDSVGCANLFAGRILEWAFEDRPAFARRGLGADDHIAFRAPPLVPSRWNSLKCLAEQYCGNKNEYSFHGASFSDPQQTKGIIRRPAGRFKSDWAFAGFRRRVGGGGQNHCSRSKR